LRGAALRSRRPGFAAFDALAGGEKTKEVDMGLLDILSGMSQGQSQRQGMSPIVTALLGLLAYKAVQGGGLGSVLGGRQPGGTAQPQAPGGGGLGDVLGSIFGGSAGAVPDAMPSRSGGSGVPAGGGGAPAGGGGLGDLLGGILAGGAGGSVLSGGLGQIIQDMQRAGQGQAAQSWVGRGDNDPVAPDDLARALGADTLSQLSSETGMPQDELLQGLSQHLPGLVDQLTPEGRLPTEDEAAKW
jgi:uncharacterized protein YidB (DUF937 family)